MAEGWAEFYSAKMINDREHINNNEFWFPTATQKMEQFMELLYSYYINYYSSLYGTST